MSLYADIDSGRYRLLELNPELLEYVTSSEDPAYVFGDYPLLLASSFNSFLTDVGSL